MSRFGYCQGNRLVVSCVEVDMGRGIQPWIDGDRRVQAVVKLWTTSGRTRKTIRQYLVWIRRFQLSCAAHQLDELSELSYAGAMGFVDRYVGPRVRRASPESRSGACSALRAWACTLRSLGYPLEDWRPAKPAPKLSPLLRAYCDYRLQHCGVAPATWHRDRAIAARFLALSRSRGQSAGRIRISDIDAFVVTLTKQTSSRTVARDCSCLRAFLRFLHVTGRVRRNLAAEVMAPRWSEEPPVVLPWSRVRAVLNGIELERGSGRRDYAILLLTAAYGLGAGEVIGITLDDIDWSSRSIHVRRPKTLVPIVLPLLPEVGRALASYLKHGRPRHAVSRALFVGIKLPHRALSSGAIRHIVRKHARAAGVSEPVLGAHAFRRCHATRQVDAGVNPKILSDILGHRRPSSTSRYVLVATRRLRQMALPVPR